MLSDQLKRVILDALELDDFELGPETAACQVPGWDSLSHLAVLAAIEAAFDIRFSTIEVLRLRNVGELQALIESKRGPLS